MLQSLLGLCTRSARTFAPLASNNTNFGLNFWSYYRATRLCHTNHEITEPLTTVTFEKICEETLESLGDYFEELVESCPHLKETDVNLGDGVLTVQFGVPYGTYVINRQRPNLQIWLSSPTSGPKRYDFVQGLWVYKRDGVSLHKLLEQEVTKIVKKPVDLSNCAYSKS